MSETDPRSPLTGTDPTHPVMAHILFMDMVGFTRLPMEKQRVYVKELQTTVFSTSAFQEADAAGQVIVRPTGDGMALAFLQNLLLPAQVARTVSEEIRGRQDLKVRMGLHSGHVFLIRDANGSPDIIGEGINTAQRVMDCGDVGHILLSAAAAQQLQGYEDWKRWIQSVGEAEVKHGQVVQLYNLCSRRFGNGRIPRKVSGQKLAKLELGRNIQRAARLSAAAVVVAALAYFGPKVYPSAREWTFSVYNRLFRPSNRALLESSSEKMGRKLYAGALEDAQAVLSSPEATAEERAEATYRLVAAALAKGDNATAKTALDTFAEKFKTLDRNHWVRRALQIEPPLNTARDLYASGKHEAMIPIAQRISDNTDARPEQRAEANYLLLETFRKRGRPDRARTHLARLEKLKQSLPAGHYTLKDLASLADALKPPPPPPGPEEVLRQIRSAGIGDEARITKLAQQVLGMRDASSAQRAEAQYHLLAAAAKRGDLSTTGRLLEVVRDRQSLLEAAYQGDVDSIRKDYYLKRAAAADEAEQWTTASTMAQRALEAVREIEKEGGQVDAEKAQAWFYRVHALEKLGKIPEAHAAIERAMQDCAKLKRDDPTNSWLESIGEIDARITVGSPVSNPAGGASAEPPAGSP
jgi:class 3 adenylate cyclase